MWPKTFLRSTCGFKPRTWGRALYQGIGGKALIRDTSSSGGTELVGLGVHVGVCIAAGDETSRGGGAGAQASDSATRASDDGDSNDVGGGVRDRDLRIHTSFNGVNLHEAASNA